MSSTYVHSTYVVKIQKLTILTSPLLFEAQIGKDLQKKHKFREISTHAVCVSDICRNLPFSVLITLSVGGIKGYQDLVWVAITGFRGSKKM